MRLSVAFTMLQWLYSGTASQAFQVVAGSSLRIVHGLCVKVVGMRQKDKKKLSKELKLYIKCSEVPERRSSESGLLKLHYRPEINPLSVRVVTLSVRSIMRQKSYLYHLFFFILYSYHPYHHKVSKNGWESHLRYFHLRQQSQSHFWRLIGALRTESACSNRYLKQVR